MKVFDLVYACIFTIHGVLSTNVLADPAIAPTITPVLGPEEWPEDKIPAGRGAVADSFLYSIETTIVATNARDGDQLYSLEQQGSSRFNGSLIASMIKGSIELANERAAKHKDPKDRDHRERDPYAPFNTSCPEHPLVRNSDGLSEHEKKYISERRKKTNANLLEFLKRANLDDFDPEEFINQNVDSHSITIGLAFSGGGFRAMLSGAGQMMGLDGRYEPANTQGLGGLLQSTSYISGLSGGSWLIGSLVLGNWIAVSDILDGKIPIWNLRNSILTTEGINTILNTAHYHRIKTSIEAKAKAGFVTTITDIWGRAIAHQLIQGDSRGVTWSSIRELETFKNHEIPFPIVLANGRHPESYTINENSTIFEITPYELGTWDPSLHAFTDIEYLGSLFGEGQQETSRKCRKNFDNAGFIMGTSSSLFNQMILYVDDYDIPSIAKPAVKGVLSILSNKSADIAVYDPNPFYDWEGAGEITMAKHESLYLVDGGEDGQNVPIYPLIQPSRKVDVIFTFDNSADTKQSWPNGFSLVATYLRQFSKQGKGKPFPFVPHTSTFENDNLTEKPIFFGCYAEELSPLVYWHDRPVLKETDIPLVIAIFNRAVSYESNLSTIKLQYADQEKEGVIMNGFDIVTRNKLSEDEEWTACVGCAIIRRQQERLGHEQSNQCKECFDRYCWKGGMKDAANAPEVHLEEMSSRAEEPSESGNASEEKSQPTKESFGTRFQLSLFHVAILICISLYFTKMI
ncbi:plb1 [[Candida] subhashii]|uniref:Lysophospholipase n=1 Tax=[Candida] subhashii TaxID=561895 RepID=A0A8J5QII2_9ASCO|nr:plb1 [[Candida] subhashii]KAG7663642.1 plb1 [[Candida] subhashii]